MKILLIFDDKAYSTHVKRALEERQFVADQAFSLQDALIQARKVNYDAVVCCVPVLNNRCPKEILALVQKASPQAGIIFITENYDMPIATELVRHGLFTCMNRPVAMEQLSNNLIELRNDQKVAQEGQKKPDNAKLSLDSWYNTQPGSRHYVTGTSKNSRQLYQQIDLVGPTSYSVIIHGETGTGKESVARCLAKTQDKKAPFIAVDCGCLSKELAVSELFGHEKGSFTGAMSTKAGAFELAHKGTIFLDEICNLDYEVQGYLLRAIQERRIRRLGGATDIEVEVRIIVASNENLRQAVTEGKFREDLYHRLNEFEILIPPLRERKADLPAFIAHFIQEANAELDKNIPGVDEACMQLLLHYLWPGNIRELRNVLRRACLLTDDGCRISKEILPAEVQFSSVYQPSQQGSNDIPEANYKEGDDNHRNTRSIGLKDIEAALKKVNFNKTKAAALLHIDRKTLYNKLKSFSLPFILPGTTL